MREVYKIKKRMQLILAIFFLSITAVISFYNVATYRQYLASIRDKTEQTMSVYADDIGESMNQIQKMLVEQTINFTLIQNISQSGNKIMRYKSYEEQKNKFDENIECYPLLDGIMMYDMEHDAYIGTAGSEMSDQEHLLIKENVSLLVDDFQSQNDRNLWFSEKIGEAYYLFYLICVNDIYYGAWIKADHLVSGLVENTEDTSAIFVIRNNSSEQILNYNSFSIIPKDNMTAKMGNVSYLVYEKDLEAVPFALLCLQKDETFSLMINHLIVPIMIVLFIAVVAYLVLVYMLKQAVLTPYDDILLKEEIRRQKTELQFLQKQISPHFLNNCLSLIRNFIFLEDNEHAEKATILLGKYTRGSLNTQLEISLQTELENVVMFCHLQKMRFEGRIQLQLEVDEELFKALVPTMLIQTFVENSIKYEMEEESLLKILVRVKKSHDEQMELTIVDSGDGFSEEVLQKIRQGKEITDQDGLVHIGIYNVTQRMKLLYGDSSHIDISNSEVTGEGAKIHILIPIRYETGGEQHEK